jgi:peptide-methionine (S)-S-oxide reductase
MVLLPILLVACLAFPTMNAQTTPHPDAPAKAIATVGGGCFWCLEAAFERFNGVETVVSGYAAGNTPNPTYKQVCTGSTGHAEVVQVTFNPAVISYGQILEIFWEIHDPTTLNAQGPDHGTQYRSIIITHNAAQETEAKASLQKAQEKYKQPIVTQITPPKKFYPAEDYHQDFFAKNPSYPYCAVMISPKLKKLEKLRSVLPPQR